MGDRLKAAVVGCRMGGGHARTLAALQEDYELVGLCDLNEAVAREVSGKTGGAPVYPDYDIMLQEAKPDVVVVATPTGTHLPFTERAVQAGARGVYCEKPMTTNLRDAYRMLSVCKAAGAALAIGHQRRMSAPYLKMRELVEAGAIGDLVLMRGSCAGDFLSDGTHTVDSLLYLNGDLEVNWLLGQVYRDKVDRNLPDQWDYRIFTGRRYGHVVENGAMAAFEFSNGVRAEVFTGELRLPGRGYQDIELFGTKGRLWRAGDGSEPMLVIDDGQGTGWCEVPLEAAERGQDMRNVFASFAATVRNGTHHPLNGYNAVRCLEIVMAVYESARLRDRVQFPLRQFGFPLELMVEAGQI